MEISGNNRYELLFMDDEGAAPVKTVEVPAKKKQSSTAINSTSKKTQPATVEKKKSTVHIEKENKTSTLNNNDRKKNSTAVGGQQLLKSKPGAPFGNDKIRSVEDGDATANNKKERPVNFGRNDGNEQRYDRRNFRDGVGARNGAPNAGNEFSNEQRQQQRQYRENRGAQRRFGENGFRNGKREFDRQSGSDKTGVKSIDKRDGAGAHNWGSVKQEIEDINKNTGSGSDTEPALVDKDDSNTNDATEQAADVSTVVVEEETKVMTLDEWKAMKQPRNKPQFNIRKPGEGEDVSQWNEMTALNKKKENGESEEEFEYDPSMYPQRVGRLQRIVDIEFKFNDNRRGGFSRGRGRGFRPGGPARGGRFENTGHVGNNGDVIEKPIADKPRKGLSNVLKVDDERQFPTLS